ncbi:MAG: helix-hairpin-helix domain-containing protein [Bacteroidota bacterium]
MSINIQRRNDTACNGFPGWMHIKLEMNDIHVKRILYIMIAGLIICSCSSSSTNSNEDSYSNEKAAGGETAMSNETKVNSSVYILNPNLASRDDIYSLGLLDTDVESIIDGRPYLDPLTFLNKIKEVVGDSKYEEIKSKIFLPMNLNTTAEEDFKQVPGVGDKMAHEFEEYRPYTSIVQFRREIGKYVSEEEVAEYEKYVFVPVNLNTASREELLAIPGLGDKIAHEFEEYRPYKNMKQFRREIGKYVDDDELARLERYVTLQN